MIPCRHRQAITRCLYHISRVNGSTSLRRSRGNLESSCRFLSFIGTRHEQYESRGGVVVTHKQRLVANSCIVQSSNNVPLTVTDVQLRHEQLPFAYFFKETHNADLLASSLEQVLQWYPILGGSINLAAGQIECKPGRDTIPLSFAKSNKPLSYWLQEGKGHSYTGGCGHPELLPLFDPLFPPSTSRNGESQYSANEDNHCFEDLIKIRITHCEGGGTVIGVNMNHALGDAASCIRFVQCWGREMRNKAYPRGTSNDRSTATCSGMVTEELAELMGFQQHKHNDTSNLDMLPKFVLFGYDKAAKLYEELKKTSNLNLPKVLQLDMMGSVDATPLPEPSPLVSSDRVVSSVQSHWWTTAGLFAPGSLLHSLALDMKHQDKQLEIFGDRAEEPTSTEHEYVLLPFSHDALAAMKAYGMEACQKAGKDSNKDDVLHAKFVSTNDMMTACGWLMKRYLSGNKDWNMSMVVNLRGRCGVDDFTDMNDVGGDTSGVFGNGITNVIASLPESNLSSALEMNEVAAGAMAIRRAMTKSLRDVPDRISRSRMGKPMTSTTSTGPSFSTTSWGQFPLWDICFSSKSKLTGFHGHPSHPLPLGRTFSSVIAPRQDGGYVYKLLVPSDKATEARRMHRDLCSRFNKWYKVLQ